MQFSILLLYNCIEIVNLCRWL